MQIRKSSNTEFVLIMASLMSLASLSIDALLPGIQDISKAIGISDLKNSQLLITMIFLGIGVGQLFLGPLSDSIGRKTTNYIGFAIFFLSSTMCIFSTSIEIMVLGRFLQGIGLSAPRTISIAMVRDKFDNDQMAKIMSFVMGIFILAPVIAPAFGKVMLDNFGWQSIFTSQLIFGFVVILWLWLRQEETLADDQKKKMTWSLFSKGFKEYVRHKQTMVFTFVTGLIFASFIAFLSACQQIIQEQYGLVEEFTYIFSGIALIMGLSSFFNGALVVKYGMMKLTYIFVIVLTLSSLVYVVSYYEAPNPNIIIFLIFLSLTVFALGFIFGNVNALTMQPIGHIAGIGAAFSGFLSTLIAVPIATLIGQFIDQSAWSLFAGFAICGILSLVLVIYMKSYNRKQ
ncbi:MAG: multidrug effflux MFS transporter, partial [Carboxylicivirga sp.]|nr:multidrug effflux MFS transporter [Carboxylicivirga sp.]